MSMNVKYQELFSEIYLSCITYQTSKASFSFQSPLKSLVHVKLMLDASHQPKILAVISLLKYNCILKQECVQNQRIPDYKTSVICFFSASGHFQILCPVLHTSNIEQIILDVSVQVWVSMTMMKTHLIPIERSRRTYDDSNLMIIASN